MPNRSTNSVEVRLHGAPGSGAISSVNTSVNAVLAASPVSFW